MYLESLSLRLTPLAKRFDFGLSYSNAVNLWFSSTVWKGITSSVFAVRGALLVCFFAPSSTHCRHLPADHPPASPPLTITYALPAHIQIPGRSISFRPLPDLFQTTTSPLSVTLRHVRYVILEGYRHKEGLTKLPGIFAYCSFLTEKERKYVCEVLCNGLARLEYRGYDSAGTSFLNIPFG